MKLPSNDKDVFDEGFGLLSKMEDPLSEVEADLEDSKLELEVLEGHLQITQTWWSAEKAKLMDDIKFKTDMLATSTDYFYDKPEMIEQDRQSLLTARRRYREEEEDVQRGGGEVRR